MLAGIGVLGWALFDWYWSTFVLAITGIAMVAYATPEIHHWIDK